MYKCQAVLHTCGDGYWSTAAKAVTVTGLQLAYTNDELDFGELRVQFAKGDWDVDADGLIYTDTQFLDELRDLLASMGIDASDVSYSEQGMQGDNYVSLDVGERFINTFVQVA